MALAPAGMQFAFHGSLEDEDELHENPSLTETGAARRLVGLITHRDILRLLVRGHSDRNGEAVSVRQIMKTEPVTVAPSTETVEAIELMRRHRVGCLPVVEGGVLVGIITAKDFLDASARLFEESITPLQRGRRD